MNTNDVLDIMIRIIQAHAALLVSDGLLVAGIIMLACRIEKMMRGVTELRVFVQHFALACSLRLGPGMRRRRSRRLLRDEPEALAPGSAERNEARSAGGRS